MPHRVKNKHRARHRSATFKAASLSRPALPLPADQKQPETSQAAVPEQISAEVKAEEPTAAG